MTKRTFLRNTHTARGPNAGFSLVELIVAISVMMLLSISLVSQQSRFDSSIYLQNAAYEVSLAVREAQVYAIRGRNVAATSCSDRDCPYGVYFNKSELGEDEYSMVLFRDSNGDGDYDPTNNELIEGYRFESGNSIAEFTESNGDAVSGSELHVTFERPSPTPQFSDGRIDDAHIVLQNVDGTEVAVELLASGQISVIDASEQ